MSDSVPEGFEVSFTEMKHGTREDYLALHALEQPFVNQTVERVLRELARQGDETLAGYKISRLEHGLQSATRALDDGADIDCIVAALLHDIGDGLAPQNHDKMAAEIVRPFVRDEVSWTVCCMDGATFSVALPDHTQVAEAKRAIGVLREVSRSLSGARRSRWTTRSD